MGDQAYWKDVIKPMIDSSPNVEIGERGKGEFLGNADALLFPIDWPEPFGLVMIEAMACGTPVIAFRRGAAPECRFPLRFDPGFPLRTDPA
jgi:glycosyltransferase involved in cell wall biosynthesis